MPLRAQDRIHFALNCATSSTPMSWISSGDMVVVVRLRSAAAYISAPLRQAPHAGVMRRARAHALQRRDLALIGREHRVAHRRFGAR